MKKKMRVRTSIIEALKDPGLFGSLLKDLSTWKAWITCLKAIFGLLMDESELILYEQCTGRKNPPKKQFREVFLICGRRSGKSFITSIIAVFLAVFRDYSKYLAPGERGTIMIIASDRRQARIVFNYIKSILSLPLFKSYVERETMEAIELINRVNIEVHTASYKAVRGYTVIGAILEETSFWNVEGANPDREIYTAIKPAMSTIPESMLVGISTPYARQGLLYEKYKQYHGVEDEETLIWKAPSLVMNPTLNKRMIDRELLKDPSSARAEWEAEFREDIETFLSLETIESVVIPGRVELPPIEGVRYVAFVDPSGGGLDQFTLSIGHREGQKIIQDVLRGRRGDPHQIVREYSEILRRYRINEVTGDKYAGSWAREAFREGGILYKPSELSKSELYLEALPYFNPSFLELLDNKEMIREFRQLERKRGSSGRDTIDHPKIANVHDDLANATAGLIVGCLRNAIQPIGYGIEPGEEDWLSDSVITRRRRSLVWLFGGLRGIK